MSEIRIDKWLWAVRLFKTRSLASEACAKGRILMSGNSVKASRTIKVGDIIQVKKAPITYSFEVIGITDKRVGPKLAPLFLKDVTPQEQYEILEMTKISGINRDKHTGRPTKRERRKLDEFAGSLGMYNFFDISDEE